MILNIILNNMNNCIYLFCVLYCMVYIVIFYCLYIYQYNVLNVINIAVIIARFRLFILCRARPTSAP